MVETGLEHTGNEEDDERNVVFVASERQLRRHAIYICIGNVNTVEERQQVQDAQERYDVKVDASHELALSRMRWTFDLQIVVVAVCATTRIAVCAGIVRRVL